MTDPDFATRTELGAVRREIRELRLLVSQLAARRPCADPRLADLLARIYRFSKSQPWTVSELLALAGRDDRPLWDALDAIAGPRGDMCKRLGRFFERNAGAEVDAFRLVPIKREAGSWMYTVQVVGD